jgi:hypothetical protein
MIGTSTTTTTSIRYIFVSEEDLERIQKRILYENRELKITSILENKKYIPKRIEDDNEYK